MEDGAPALLPDSRQPLLYERMENVFFSEYKK